MRNSIIECMILYYYFTLIKYCIPSERKIQGHPVENMLTIIIIIICSRYIRTFKCIVPTIAYTNNCIKRNTSGFLRKSYI